jgi:hypothetical protein
VPTKRVRLHHEPWSWTLEQVADSFVLMVLCGSVGLDERALVLKPDEIDAWHRAGPEDLRSLVATVQLDGTGTRFADRYRPDLV